jgi:pimeloyl-ACP methyl ester carboxylesterase
VLVTGAGAPVTLFAHGFASSIGETRPFGSGVDGSRVFFHFRGHGRSTTSAGAWSYEALAADAEAVADACRATRAVGVSLGAGALLALVARHPDRFERLVLILPAAIDRPRSGRALARVDRMAERADAGDAEAVAQVILDEQPASVRDRRWVRLWARQQADRMIGDSLRPVMRAVPRAYPLVDRASLRSVEASALVIGQRGDEAHPASVAEDLAASLPRAEARVLPPGGVLWLHRAETRALITSFLNA